MTFITPQMSLLSHQAVRSVEQRGRKHEKQVMTVTLSSVSMETRIQHKALPSAQLTAKNTPDELGGPAQRWKRSEIKLNPDETH